MKSKFRTVIAASVLTLCGAFAATTAQAQTATCDRACMASLVDQLLGSMVAHNPDTLPLASSYGATENSHPAALGMMTAWRTITKAGKPSMLAIDTEAGQAYFALTVDESASPSVLWGRIKVVDRRIAEVEIFINRSRGDHGFSFSPEQLPTNYAKVMSPPAGRKLASHEDLVKLSRAAFDASDPLKVDVADDCQFTEEGWQVVDPGLDDVPPMPAPGGMAPRDPEAPLGCMFPPFRPTDKAYRVIAIDDTLGLVVVAAVVPGVTYPYPFHGHMLSAFIPSEMKEPLKAQDAWVERHLKAGKAPIVKPQPGTGEVMQVLQLYDGKLHALQLSLYLSGPGAQSIWRQPTP